MTSYTVRFEEFRHKEVRSGNCPTCGGRVRRNTTFTETQSPFNRNAYGVPKSVAEIEASLREKGAMWVPNFEHYKCEEKRLGRTGSE